MKGITLLQRTLATATISYAGYRFSSVVVSYAVRQCPRFPLSLRVVEELRAELAQAVPPNGAGRVRNHVFSRVVLISTTRPSVGRYCSGRPMAASTAFFPARLHKLHQDQLLDLRVIHGGGNLGYGGHKHMRGDRWSLSAIAAAT